MDEFYDWETGYLEDSAIDAICDAIGCEMYGLLQFAASVPTSIPTVYRILDGFPVSPNTARKLYRRLYGVHGTTTVPRQERRTEPVVRSVGKRQYQAGLVQRGRYRASNR